MEKSVQEIYWKPRKETLTDKIIAGNIYRSRGGFKVRVYEVLDNAIHGCIILNGIPTLETWHTSGSYLSNSKDHFYDIIVTPKREFKEKTKYRTKEGRLAIIYAINKGNERYPMIGAVLNDKNFWEPRTWNVNGLVDRYAGSGNDLAELWSDT